MSKPATTRRSEPAAKPPVDEMWELRLYVAGQTPKSVAAFSNLKNLCETTFDILFTIVMKNGAAELTPSRYGAPSPRPGADCM